MSHSSYVFKGTLRENMKMAKIDATDEQIYACLEQVNLAQFVRDNGGLDMQLLSRRKFIWRSDSTFSLSACFTTQCRALYF